MAWYYIQAVTQTAAAEAAPVFGNLLQAANFKIHLEGNEKKREPSEQDSPLALKKSFKKVLTNERQRDIITKSLDGENKQPVKKDNKFAKQACKRSPGADAQDLENWTTLKA